MRFRLLKRRLTISAPSMAIRSAMPWPIKWALAAVVLGFCAAISLWAFEFGKDLAGLDRNEKEQLINLQSEVIKLRDERDKAQSIANTSGSIMATEKATQEKLLQTVKQLESENRTLRDDLGFFERLIPTGSGEGLAIRGFHAEVLPSQQLKWQVLVLQPNKNAPEFKGRVELLVTGLGAGKPISINLPAPMPFDVKQYRRLEGLLDLPPSAQIKNVLVKIIEGTGSGGAVKVTQSIKVQ